MKEEKLVFEATFPVVCKLCKLMVGWTDYEPRIGDIESQFVCIPCFDLVKIERK